MLVKESKLNIKPSLIKKEKSEEEEKEDEKKQNLFPEVNLGIFNPVINKKQRTLVYIKFSFRGVNKVVIYDCNRQPNDITIPDDYM